MLAFVCHCIFANESSPMQRYNTKLGLSTRQPDVSSASFVRQVDVQLVCEHVSIAVHSPRTQSSRENNDFPIVHQVAYVRRLAAALDISSSNVSSSVFYSPPQRPTVCRHQQRRRQQQQQRRVTGSQSQHHHHHRQHQSSLSSVFRCNGFFLACFQTTHVWGNLVSSVLLGAATSTASSCADDDDDGDRSRQFDRNSLMYFDGVAGAEGGAYCGTYDTCDGPEMGHRSFGFGDDTGGTAAVLSNTSASGEYMCLSFVVS